MLVRIVAIVYLIVAGASAYSSLNNTYSKNNTANSSILAKREHDTARIPKVYALKTLNNVLTKIINRKKVTKTMPRPTSAKSKIECKDASDLIIILDNTVPKKDYARLLDFVATVSAAWRSNLKCHVAFIPEYKEVTQGSTTVPIGNVEFDTTENLDEYEIKAEVYKIQFGNVDDSMKGDLKHAVDSVADLITKHMKKHPVQTNVLLITASATYTGTFDTVKPALTSMTNVNTLAIGVSGMVKEDLLTAFAKDTTEKVKLIQSVEGLKDCTDFVQKNLK